MITLINTRYDTFAPVPGVVTALQVDQLRDKSAAGFYEKIGWQLCDLFVTKPE